MSDHHDSRHESLVLKALHPGEILTLEELVARLPELSWSQLFQSVDALSRRGTIRLRRRGFQYEVALAQAGALSVV